MFLKNEKFFLSFGKWTRLLRMFCSQSNKRKGHWMCVCVCGIPIQINRCQLPSVENKGFLCFSPMLSKLLISAMTQRFNKLSALTLMNLQDFISSFVFAGGLNQSNSSLSLSIFLAPFFCCFFGLSVSFHMFLCITSFFQVSLVTLLLIYDSVMSPTHPEISQI